MEKIKIESKKEEEEDKIKKKIKIEKLLANRIELEKQIVDREEREKMKRVKELEEGKKIKKEQDKYLMSLEEIRKQKIQELKDLKIKDEYILPLEKYNYNNIIIRKFNLFFLSNNDIILKEVGKKYKTKKETKRRIGPRRK